MTTTQHAAPHSTPGNRRDRERFAALTPWEAEVALRIVARSYDGTRTLASCWKLALDAVEETA